MGATKMSFTVPATSGQYATQRYYCALDPTKPERLEYVDAVQVMITARPSNAVLDIQVLSPGEDPKDGTWTTVESVGTTALTLPIDLLGVYGVRFAAKSGGTSGTLTANVWWYGR